MRHHLWAKVWYQHRVSAPSPSAAITHQPSKKFDTRNSYMAYKDMPFGRRSRDPILASVVALIDSRRC